MPTGVPPDTRAPGTDKGPRAQGAPDNNNNFRFFFYLPPSPLGIFGKIQMRLRFPRIPPGFPGLRAYRPAAPGRNLLRETARAGPPGPKSWLSCFTLRVGAGQILLATTAMATTAMAPTDRLPAGARAEALPSSARGGPSPFSRLAGHRLARRAAHAAHVVARAFYFSTRSRATLYCWTRSLSKRSSGRAVTQKPLRGRSGARALSVSQFGIPFTCIAV